MLVVDHLKAKKRPLVTKFFFFFLLLSVRIKIAFQSRKVMELGRQCGIIPDCVSSRTVRSILLSGLELV